MEGARRGSLTPSVAPDEPHGDTCRMAELGSHDEGTPREQELVRENAVLRARVAELEARVSAGTVGSSTRLPAPPSPPDSARVLPTVPSLTPPAAPPTDSMPVRAPASAMDVEQFIGRRVVPFVGAIAVLGAVGYLVNYAIEIGLIGRVPPEARFACGVLIGLALLALGEFVRRRGAPGAATGLDAAGVGAVMVSVALGVFTLGLFGPATASWMAGAAALLAAAWSIRCGSVAVTIVALIGIYAMPASVGLVRDEPVRAGVLLALALAIGLGTHLIGGSRFAAARYLAVLAAIVLGIPVLASVQGAAEAFVLALCWWFMVVSECTLAAQRGIDARGNAVIALIASVALVLVEVGAWASTTMGGLAIEALPSSAGGILFAGALLLRPMAFDPKDDDERAALGQQGIAIGRACALLSQSYGALALAMGVGGTVFLIGPSTQAVVLTATALAAVWIERRNSWLVYGLVGCVLALAGAAVGVYHAIDLGALTQAVSVPFAPDIDLTVRWSAAIGALGLSVALLFAIGSVMRRAWLGAVLVPAMLLGWLAFSARMVPSVLGSAVLVVPALAVAWIPRARLVTVIASLLLVLVAAVWWCGWSIDASWGIGRRGTVELIAVVIPWIAAVVLLSRHPALSRARGVIERIAVIVSGLAVSFVASIAGSHAGFDGIAAGFTIVIALAAVSAVVVMIARLVRSDTALDAGLVLAGAMLGTCGFLGLVRLFERTADEGSPMLEFGALASVVAAVALAVACARGSVRTRTRAHAISAVAAFAAAPFLVLLLSAAVGRPLAPAAAAGALVAVGIAQLVIGFRRSLPAFRWGGLACFGVLVLRLYAVDLANAPMLVRIGLLFVSGMVLVGTGIVYARNTRAHS